MNIRAYLTSKSVQIQTDFADLQSYKDKLYTNDIFHDRIEKDKLLIKRSLERWVHIITNGFLS